MELYRTESLKSFWLTLHDPKTAYVADRVRVPEQLNIARYPEQNSAITTNSGVQKETVHPIVIKALL
jgi:hypothetical protein